MVRSSRNGRIFCSDFQASSVAEGGTEEDGVEVGVGVSSTACGCWGVK